MDLLYYLAVMCVFLYSLFVLLTGVLLALASAYPKSSFPLWKIIALSLVFPLTWKWIRKNMK